GDRDDRDLATFVARADGSHREERGIALRESVQDRVQLFVAVEAVEPEIQAGECTGNALSRTAAPQRGGRRASTAPARARAIPRGSRAHPRARARRCRASAAPRATARAESDRPAARR